MKKIKLNEVVKILWDYEYENAEKWCHKKIPIYIDAKITIIVPSGLKSFLVCFTAMPYENKNIREKSKILRVSAKDVEFDGQYYILNNEVKHEGTQIL